jgi:hypothetical protein
MEDEVVKTLSGDVAMREFGFPTHSIRGGLAISRTITPI